MATWHRLLVEVTQCQERLRGLAENTVRSPLYRLPTSTYQLHFHTLMMESDLHPARADTFQRYYQFVNQLNDGLDLAAEAVQQNNIAVRDQQYERNRAKAAKVVKQEGQPNSLYDDARAVIYAELQRLGDQRYLEWLKTIEASRMPRAASHGSPSAEA